MCAVKMNGYKKKIIELVRDQPLLWDPQNTDYHNKDQRRRVWEDIDSKCLPAGTNTNSKAIWESLSRSFSNALRRQNNKPSGSEAGNDKEWRFQKDLMFLLPVKTLRKASGNFPGPDLDLDTSINEDSFSFQSQPDNVAENPSQEDTTQVETAIGIQKEIVSSMQEPVRKRKAVENIEHDDITSMILEIMKQRQVEKSKESTRLSFFRSLMPSIDKLDEDEFMNFQMDVIQALQRRVRRHSGAYHQQQQSPTPSSHLSEASSDSHPG